MCGIFGIVFDEEKEIGKILINAAKKLTYRGYDSAGFASFFNGKSDLRKDVGTLDEVVSKYDIPKMKGDRGIVQLRWATFGRPSKINAQPFYDCTHKIVGAHNGNIVNCLELESILKREGHKLEGKCDGEMLIHLFEKCLGETNDWKRAIYQMSKELRGDYSCILAPIDEKKIYVVKSGSSLYLGIGKDFICSSSDLPSILPLTKNIVRLRDGEFVEFDNARYQIYSLDGKKMERNAKESDLTPEMAEKGGYEHFMLKEIHEQPRMVRGLLKAMKEQSKYVKRILDLIEEANHVYIVGSGTSHNACVVASYYFNKLAHIPVTPVIAGQFIDLYGNCIDDDDVIICVSQSGETKDLINVVNHLRRIEKGKIIGIMNVLGSTLMLNSDAYLPLVCELEISVPATKTFLNQIVLLLYLALEIAKEKRTMGEEKCNELEKEMDVLPELLQKTINETEKESEILGRELAKYQDIYCLGYGASHGISLEGALKIKEITYAHCEGMYSSEFKHGPLARIEDDYPVIFTTTPEDAGMILSHMNEVKCRKGRIITIAEECKPLRDTSTDYVPVPTSNPTIAPIINVIPLQLLAYYWSIEKGINPDFPRNLSKTLTVD